MARIIAFFIFIFGTLTIAISATSDPEGEGKRIQINPEQTGQTDRPKKPAYCPFSGVINEYSITLFSTVSSEVEITVTDVNGMTVYEDTADLYGGYVIPLEEGIDYGMLYLTIGSKTYKAVL